MAEHNIEYNIQSKLSPEEQEVAMDFVRFLVENNLSFNKDNSAYWKDKIYYWVKQEDALVCFIAIKNPDEESNHWTIWSTDMNSEWLENDPTSDELIIRGWRICNF